MDLQVQVQVQMNVQVKWKKMTNKCAKLGVRTTELLTVLTFIRPYYDGTSRMIPWDWSSLICLLQRVHLKTGWTDTATSHKLDNGAHLKGFCRFGWWSCDQPSCLIYKAIHQWTPHYEISKHKSKVWLRPFQVFSNFRSCTKKFTIWIKRQSKTKIQPLLLSNLTVWHHFGHKLFNQTLWHDKA